MCDISSPAELELLLQDSYNECGTHGIHVHVMQMVQNCKKPTASHVHMCRWLGRKYGSTHITLSRPNDRHRDILVLAPRNLLEEIRSRSRVTN